jgi:hypothetical protein
MSDLIKATDVGRKAKLIGLYEDVKDAIPSIAGQLEGAVNATSKAVDKANIAARGVVRSVVSAISKEISDVNGVLAVTSSSHERYGSLVSVSRNYDSGSKYCASISFRVIIFLSDAVDVRELAYRLRREALGPSFYASTINMINDDYLYDIDPFGLSIKIPAEAKKYMTLTFREDQRI